MIDIRTPQHIIDKHLKDSFLFPPIIKRVKLDESYLSDFMKSRYQSENKKLDMSDQKQDIYLSEEYVWNRFERQKVGFHATIKVSNALTIIA